MLDMLKEFVEVEQVTVNKTIVDILNDGAETLNKYVGDFNKEIELMFENEDFSVRKQKLILFKIKLLLQNMSNAITTLFKDSQEAGKMAEYVENLQKETGKSKEQLLEEAKERYYKKKGNWN